MSRSKFSKIIEKYKFYQNMGKIYPLKYLYLLLKYFKKLIKEDERLAKILSDLKQQHDQLDATKINTKNFNDLTKQKVGHRFFFIVIVI